MTKTSEFRTKPSEPLISGAAKAVFLLASHIEVPLNRGGLPVSSTRTGPEPGLGTLAACGVAGLSRRVRRVDRLRGSAARDIGNSSGSRRVAGR